MENRFMVAHDKAKGQCKIQGSMKHDELTDMGHLMPIKKRPTKNIGPIF